MHKVQQRRARVPIYTYCEGNDVISGVMVMAMLLKMVMKILIDVYTCVYSCRQCWASKCRGL
jgi:hypothetical protein